MARGIKLHVWGDYALFTRPEMKAERVSYDIMTPSAARGIVSAIYWKPEIDWVIDKIHILKPIRFASVRRNEVSCKATVPTASAMAGDEVDPLGFSVEEKRQQRASLLLCDVAYVIEAHFELLATTLVKDGPELSESECEAKHISMFNRRGRAGQAFHQPCMGCREFPAHFELIEHNDELPSSDLPDSQRNKDFGFVFHDFIYHEDKKGRIIESNTGKKLTAEARFFRAVAEDGVITVPPLNAEEVRS